MEDKYRRIMLHLLRELAKRLEDNTSKISELYYAEQLNNYLTMGDRALRDRMENMNEAYVSIIGFLEMEITSLENKSGSLEPKKERKTRKKEK